MSAVQIVVVLAVGGLTGWVLGGVVLRLGGWALMVAGVVGVMSGPGVAAVGVIALGCVMWLVGHWHYGFRHHSYENRLAACWSKRLPLASRPKRQR